MILFDKAIGRFLQGFFNPTVMEEYLRKVGSDITVGHAVGYTNNIVYILGKPMLRLEFIDNSNFNLHIINTGNDWQLAYINALLSRISNVRIKRIEREWYLIVPDGKDMEIVLK